MNETLNDFVIRKGTTVKAMGNEVLDTQANGHHEGCERTADSASQDQVIRSDTDARIENAVDSAVIFVENCMHNAVLTAKNDVIFPRVEMAVRLISGSSKDEPNSIVQKPDR